MPRHPGAGRPGDIEDPLIGPSYSSRSPKMKRITVVVPTETAIHKGTPLSSPL